MPLNFGRQVFQEGYAGSILQQFEDYIAGRSTVLYYGCASEDSGGTNYHLVGDVGYSYPKTTTGAATINFDVTLTKATSYKGKAYLDLSATHANGTTFTCRLYHYDGSTETAICDTITSVNGTGAEVEFKFELDISTQQTFAIGDILRLKIVLPDANASLNHRPDVDGDEVKLWMPVVVLDD